MDYKEHSLFIEGVKTGRWSRSQIEDFIKMQPDVEHLNSLHELIIDEMCYYIALRIVGEIASFPPESDRLGSVKELVEKYQKNTSGKDWRQPKEISDQQWAYFKKAIDKGYIEYLGDGRFKWIPKLKVKLAYFCEKVFCPDNVGTLPETLIERLFDKGKRIGSSIYMMHTATKEQKWKAEMDEDIFS